METIRLYALQHHPVPEILRRDGVCFSKPEYVSKKYDESAKLFLHNYSWFVSEAKKLVPLPEGAAFPYWTFCDAYNLERGSDPSCFLTLDVPKDQAVFFDAADWTRIMRLEPLGEPASVKAYKEELSARGINAAKAALTPYYPDLHERLLKSWTLLFRHHDKVVSGDLSCCTGGVQAGLWCLKWDWLVRE